jgi:hypothetical protein
VALLKGKLDNTPKQLLKKSNVNDAMENAGDIKGAVF